jgi:hypothetical protein
MLVRFKFSTSDLWRLSYQQPKLSYKMSDYSYRRNLQIGTSELPNEYYINNVVTSHNDLSQSSKDIKRAQQIVGPNSHVRIRRINVLMVSWSTTLSMFLIKYPSIHLSTPACQYKMYEFKSVTVEVCNGWSTVQANLNFSRYFTNKLYENW